MFDLYDATAGRRRSRPWLPASIAVAILAHAAAIGAVVAFADDAEAKPVVEVVIAEWKVDKEKPVPKPPPPPPPPPEPEPPAPKEPPRVELAPKPEPVRLRAPRPPAPVKGDFVTPRPPQNPPVGIPAPNPNAQPITQVDVSGIGKEGDVVGAVDPGDLRAPTGNTQPSEEKEAPPAPPAPPAEPAEEPNNGEPMAESEVDVRPSLRNSDEVQRALQRAYPSMLRDAGVTGQTVLQFVIDENGRVEPGSVEIVSASDEQFAAAARRVVSSMRFSPARSGGRTVRVTTTLPVRWTIER